MKDKQGSLPAVADAMRRSQTVLVISHEHPDGDAIGSTLAVGRVLDQLGKDVVCANADTVPKYLAFLPDAQRMSTVPDDLSGFDLVIVVDCGDTGRVGKAASAIDRHANVINIDHHTSNSGFGRLQYNDPDASSTGEMIWRFINAAGFSKDREIAMHLYTAIYSDTTQFSNAACTPDAFRVCGDLMELGADPVLVALEAFRKQTVSGLRLLGRALSSVRLHEAPERDAVFASMKLVQRDFEETGATVEDMEGIVEYARDIDGIEAAVLVRETRDGRIKASLRSDGSTDVSKLAVTMGGGGHPGAAGLTTDGSIDEVLSLILKALGDGSR